LSVDTDDTTGGPLTTLKVCACGPATGRGSSEEPASHVQIRYAPGVERVV
jgi:hypothetical protein